jgi:hypothetical protein
MFVVYKLSGHKKIRVNPQNPRHPRCNYSYKRRSRPKTEGFIPHSPS